MITTLRERYPELVVGLSDHQDGIAMAPVAFMLGARIVEKHFTLSHTAKGTDHAFSLMPEGMRKLVRDLRRVPIAIGDARLTIEAEPPGRIDLREAGHRAVHVQAAGRVEPGRPTLSWSYSWLLRTSS